MTTESSNELHPDNGWSGCEKSGVLLYMQTTKQTAHCSGDRRCWNGICSLRVVWTKKLVGLPDILVPLCMMSLSELLLELA